MICDGELTFQFEAVFHASTVGDMKARAATKAAMGIADDFILPCLRQLNFKSGDLNQIKHKPQCSVLHNPEEC